MYVGCRPAGQRQIHVFPVSGFGVEFFNADDRAAYLKRTVRTSAFLRASEML
jgi:hypothetical protein